MTTKKKKLQMHSQCFNSEILALMFSISYMHVSLIAEFLLSFHLQISLEHKPEVYLKSKISFSASVSLIGSSSPFPRGHSPCVL